MPPFTDSFRYTLHVGFKVALSERVPSGTFYKDLKGFSFLVIVGGFMS